MNGDIQAEILKQSQDMGWGNFKCSGCKNYGGGCICNKGIFVAFEGANTSTCVYFDEGQACPHCGRYI